MHNISNFRGQFIPLKNMPFFLPGIDFVIKVSLSLSLSGTRCPRERNRTGTYRYLLINFKILVFTGVVMELNMLFAMDDCRQLERLRQEM